jgi:hypothetical protein
VGVEAGASERAAVGLARFQRRRWIPARGAAEIVDGDAIEVDGATGALGFLGLACFTIRSRAGTAGLGI